MKLFRILPLVIGSAAAGILASTSPAHALDFNFSFSDTNNGTPGTVSGTVYGLSDNSTSSATSVSFISNISGDLGATNFTGDPGYNSFTVVNGNLTDINFYNSINGINFQLFSFNNPYGYWTGMYDNRNSGINPQVFITTFDPVSYSSTSAAVPFDIPGGATIPALGSLVAFGAIRKLRHSTASKTCIAKPVTATVS